MSEPAAPPSLPQAPAEAPAPDLPPGVQALPLPGTGVLCLRGPDRVAFLQGLVSNDVAAVGPGRAIWAAFLTPQGKYLHDMFIAAAGESLLLLCEAARREDLFRRLRLYRLRSKVELLDLTDSHGAALLYGAGAADALGLPGEAGAAREIAGGAGFVDPRLPALGVRLVLPRAALAEELERHPAGDPEGWDRLRLELGVPDGSRDLVPEKSILLESGFDELNGVSWSKGCYMGQELTARTKYRGLVKKRLMPVRIDGPAPAPGTPILADGKDAGEMRSGTGGIGLALVRLDAAAGAAPLEAGGVRLSPMRPAWAKF